MPMRRSATAIRAPAPQRCERDNRCRAWSFSYPRTTAREAICCLKNPVTPAKEDSCCVSGVRGAAVVEPNTGSLEFSIDRIGGDYRSVDVSRRSRPARPAPSSVRPTANAAPSPICGRAMAAHRTLFSEGPHHQAAAQTLLHFGRCPVGHTREEPMRSLILLPPCCTRLRQPRSPITAGAATTLPSRSR